MKFTQEKKLYLDNKALQKKNRWLQAVIHDMPLLAQMVQPAAVIPYDQLTDRSRLSVGAFADRHGYDHHKLFKLLQREKVLEKKQDTWVLTPEYQNAGMVFYTIGRFNRYRSLDMYLLPAGEAFMLAFMEAHPIKLRKKKE